MRKRIKKHHNIDGLDVLDIVGRVLWSILIGIVTFSLGTIVANMLFH